MNQIPIAEVNEDLDFEESNKPNINQITVKVNKNQEFEESNINQITAAEVNKDQESEIPNVDQITLTEHNMIFNKSFIETLKHNYKNYSPQFQTTLENVDPLAHIRSSTKIRTQVESVKRRKKAICNKKNINYHAMPAHKKQTTSKKAHSLSYNVNNNQLN
ncbi:9748_t:CDS:2 [Dentiscutata heterogama]|uniref:9748_t:CDS:1 n=1 Tax=Dentiscutata heterogama TaxID=1316150 RepID=A0ACA9NBC3_9GLOM|nr:9748_t:CDS:2 [Dentiscutata heterogama]